MAKGKEYQVAKEKEQVAKEKDQVTKAGWGRASGEREGASDGGRLGPSEWRKRRSK